ncbi:MAG: flavin-nucleotide-binding protein [Candidatus Kuenenia sp.]|nr:flavin-nucleotide-binding protein [Candidatus Kuenenia hertensis]
MSKYHLYKKEREIKEHDELLDIIGKGKYITIAMCRNNEPYIVTLSYGFDKTKNAFYLHSALKGLKCEFLSENTTVCATIIDDRGYIMDECAHAYRSLVIWGKMRFVEDRDEKVHGMNILLTHLEDNPDRIKRGALSDTVLYNSFGIFRIDIDEIKGKSGR